MAINLTDFIYDEELHYYYLMYNGYQITIEAYGKKVFVGMYKDRTFAIEKFETEGKDFTTKIANALGYVQILFNKYKKDAKSTSRTHR